MGHENIGGDAAGLLGGDTSLHGFTPMVMKRFETVEKPYLSKALLKMAGGGMHPHIPPPLDPPLALGMLLNVCLLVLRLLFFEKFARTPEAKNINMVWGPHIARVKTKNILNLRIGLFKAPLSYVD